MMKKTFDCIESQRKIRDELSNEANYDLHSIILQVKENNKNSLFFKILADRKNKQAVQNQLL
jgi:hypothetical protein